MSTDRKALLIKTLFDSTASEAERDDCAIYLADFDDEDTINILFKAACDQNISDIVKGSCGESLAEIWLRKQQIDINLLSLLKGVALTEALNLIMKNKYEYGHIVKERTDTSPAKIAFETPKYDSIAQLKAEFPPAD